MSGARWRYRTVVVRGVKGPFGQRRGKACADPMVPVFIWNAHQ